VIKIESIIRKKIQSTRIQVAIAQRPNYSKIGKRKHQHAADVSFTTSTSCARHGFYSNGLCCPVARVESKFGLTYFAGSNLRGQK
jgi:hypothetical protein